MTWNRRSISLQVPEAAKSINKKKMILVNVVMAHRIRPEVGKQWSFKRDRTTQIAETNIDRKGFI